MFSMFKNHNREIEDIYGTIMTDARREELYTTFEVPDTPQGRFQMITLHAAPHILALPPKQSQALFDMIFQDIEYSFREIGVGDLAVPKKMKRYMKDFNGILQAHAAANANHADITRRNVFGDEAAINDDFKTYIKGLFS